MTRYSQRVWNISSLRISIYKNSFGKGYTTNWWQEGFLIKKLKLLYYEHRKQNMVGKLFNRYIDRKDIII